MALYSCRRCKLVALTVRELRGRCSTCNNPDSESHPEVRDIDDQWVSLLRSGQHRPPSRVRGCMFPLDAGWQSVQFRMPTTNDPSRTYGGYIKLTTDDDTPPQPLQMQVSVNGAAPYYDHSADRHRLDLTIGEDGLLWTDVIADCWLEVRTRLPNPPVYGVSDWCGATLEIALPVYGSTYDWV